MMLMVSAPRPRRPVRYYRSDPVTGSDCGVSLPKTILGQQLYYDTVFTSTQRSRDNYPPYNIKRNGNEYVLELAVAGVSPERLDVTVEESILKITCNDSEPKDDWEYILNTVATRKFTREFTLDEDVEVTGSKLSDGMLLIYMQKAKEDKISRTIPIILGEANDKISNKPLIVEGTDQS